ncbi:YadA domain-containing protein [Caballeronia terrestris]|uniref:YadA domain-containing protein n=1 Tax=Caballeronia terrestris TaxID=1226301 RepID=A0A158I5Q5_9BURK|nr:YadA-like family protein [Caballeronia terrestris]SAL51441.1 YadA domain-containing protein [Caballeronia terrestris]
MTKRKQTVASNKQASAATSDALTQALSRARVVAAGAPRGRMMLATLALVGLPHMAHADVREEAAPAAVDARLTYASQIAQALGALSMNADALVPRVRTAATEAPAPRASLTRAASSLPPAELIKSGPTDKAQQIEALGSDSIAIGLNTRANGLQAVAIGTNSISGNEDAVAIGNSAISSGVGSTAIGVSAQATIGDRALAIGNFARAGSIDSIVIGNDSIVGDKIDVLGDPIPTANAIAIGSKNAVLGADSVVLGNGNTAYGTTSFVLGSNVNVAGTNSVILGAGSDGSASNVLSIGAKGAERRIVHVAAGTVSAASTDAVNASQLHAVASSTAAALGGGTSVEADGKVSQPSFTVGDAKYADVGSALTAAANVGVKASADAVRYDGADKASVTLGGGTAGTVLSNVAQGKQDMDAVNVSQLKSTGLIDGTGNALAAVTYDDATKGKVTFGGGTSGTVLSNVAQGKQDTDAVNVSQLKSTGLIDGTGNALAAVTYDDATKGKVTFGGGTSGTVLSNVAQGKQDLDAVNVSQLKSTGLIDGTGNALAAVTYDGPTRGKVTLGGGTAGTVLANVARGEDDLDAVNVSQLKGIGLVDGAGNALSAVVYDDATKRKATLGGSAGTVLANVAQGEHDLDAVNVSQLKSAGVIDGAGNALAAVVYDDATKRKATLGGGTAGTVLSNVAQGKQDMDAVNVSQLKSTGLVDGAGNALAAVTYDDSTKGKVTLGGGTSGTVLSNVAQGKQDMDAVNVSQLKSTGLIDGTGKALAAVTYDDATKGNVTFGGGTSGTVLSNVAQAKHDTDAVNLSQLKNAGLGVDADGNATNAFVAYDDSTKGRISLGGTDGTTIANVKAGTADTDAVNVSQLKSTGLIDSTGNTLAAVTYDDATKGSVTFGGASASAPVVLRNVAAGRVEKGSTDAVNGDQLFSTMQKVDSIQNGGSLKYFATNSSLAAATATGQDALAIGGNAQASGNNAVALGANSVADRADSVSVGAKGQERQVTNVKAGTADTDAVNVSQLKNTGLIDSKGNTAAALTYDKTASGATDYASVTLGNGVEGGTTLHNVASGSLASDAVNVGQLNDALGQLNASLGKVTNASVASTAFFTADGNTSTEGAVASGTHAAAIGANAIATGANAVAVGAGANASADNSVALGSGSVANRTNSVSVGAAGGERQVTNVAAGTSGTDAVNLDQLSRATSQANSYTDERFNNTDSQIRDLDRNTRKGIAAASALNVVTPYLPGRTAVNAGVAAYRGQAALGIGVSRWNEKGNFNFNAGVSSSGGNSTIVRAGIGYVFGS